MASDRSGLHTPCFCIHPATRSTPRPCSPSKLKASARAGTNRPINDHFHDTQLAHSVLLGICHLPIMKGAQDGKSSMRRVGFVSGLPGPRPQRARCRPSRRPPSRDVAVKRPEYHDHDRPYKEGWVEPIREVTKALPGLGRGPVKTSFAGCVCQVV